MLGVNDASNIHVLRNNCMNPRVKQVTPQPGYKLKIVFTNDEQGIYDCSQMLDFGAFQELKDVTYFNKVTVCDGTVAWPHDQDICPDTVYIDSAKEQERRQDTVTPESKA